MTKTFYIVLFILSSLFVSNTAHAQGVKSPLEEIVYLLRNAKIEEVNNYCDNFVSISINNNASNYSHNQAQQVLKDFFDKNPIRDLKVMDTGSPNAISKSMIATFVNGNNKFTLYMLVKQKDNNYVIREIKINKE